MTTATRVRPGASSLINAKSLLINDNSKFAKPVMLPPGRARPRQSQFDWISEPGEHDRDGASLLLQRR